MSWKYIACPLKRNTMDHSLLASTSVKLLSTLSCVIKIYIHVLWIVRMTVGKSTQFFFFYPVSFSPVAVKGAAVRWVGRSVCWHCPWHWHALHVSWRGHWGVRTLTWLLWSGVIFLLSVGLSKESQKNKNFFKLWQFSKNKRVYGVSILQNKIAFNTISASAS